MENGKHLDEAERRPEEVEHFLRRRELTRMIATRRPRFFPPPSKDGVFGRLRRGQTAETWRADSEG